MMGRVLAQPVLPFLPAGAVEIAPGVGLVAGADGGGLVSVHGLARSAFRIEEQHSHWQNDTWMAFSWAEGLV
jgi:hypothetical protein